MSFPPTTTNLQDNVHTAWNKNDTIWMLSLLGTAMGAGILFLPIKAGAAGLLPLLLITLLAFPMTYFSHRGLSRFVLSASHPEQDLPNVAKEHFGAKAGTLVSLLYFFAVFPILLLYSIALTNTVISFCQHQMGLNPLPRSIISAGLLLSIVGIIKIGQELLLKAMSLLVYPFIASLILLSLYLIPYWNISFWTHLMLISAPGESSSHALVHSLWLLIPLMVFSFNHSAIISSFSLAQRLSYGADSDKKCGHILRNGHFLMILIVMFFVYSCVLSLSPDDLEAARHENISILSYIGLRHRVPVLTYAAPLVAFIAITNAFLGHYLGAREGLKAILNHKSSGTRVFEGKMTLLDWSMIFSCWVIATLNPSVIGMIEILGGPITALLLFLMPVTAIYTVPALQSYRNPMRDSFVIIVGLIAFSTKLINLF